MNVNELMCACKVQGIVLKEEERRKLIFRKEVVDWVIQMDWDYFLTLTFKHPVKDPVIASKAVEKFLNNLSSKAYGLSVLLAFKLARKTVKPSILSYSKLTAKH
jgi:hypothetical protein